MIGPLPSIALSLCPIPFSGKGQIEWAKNETNWLATSLGPAICCTGRLRENKDIMLYSSLT